MSYMESYEKDLIQELDLVYGGSCGGSGELQQANWYLYRCDNLQPDEVAYRLKKGVRHLPPCCEECFPEEAKLDCCDTPLAFEYEEIEDPLYPPILWEVLRAKVISCEVLEVTKNYTTNWTHYCYDCNGNHCPDSWTTDDLFSWLNAGLTEDQNRNIYVGSHCWVSWYNCEWGDYVSQCSYADCRFYNSKTCKIYIATCGTMEEDCIKVGVVWTPSIFVASVDTNYPEDDCFLWVTLPTEYHKCNICSLTGNPYENSYVCLRPEELTKPIEIETYGSLIETDYNGSNRSVGSYRVKVTVQIETPSDYGQIKYVDITNVNFPTNEDYYCSWSPREQIIAAMNDANSRISGGYEVRLISSTCGESCSLASPLFPIPGYNGWFYSFGWNGGTTVDGNDASILTMYVHDYSNYYKMCYEGIYSECYWNSYEVFNGYVSGHCNGGTFSNNNLDDYTCEDGQNCGGCISASVNICRGGLRSGTITCSLAT